MPQPSTLENLLVLYARRFPIRRGKLRVIDSLWRAAMGDRSTRRIASLKYGGLKMPCDVSGMLHRQFYFFGTYLLAEDVLGCWENEAKRASVIVDVGANAGIFSLAALAARPDAIVHAFEPTPEIAAGLRETARLNGLGRLHVHEVAADRTSGHAALKRFRGELGTNEGMNFVRSADGDAGEELVATVSLDRFCEEQSIERIDLLKLDIQGNEHRALSGARRMLRAGRIGTIFTELNWADGSGRMCPATESIRALETAGYRFSRPARPFHWRPSGTWLRTLSDVVACRTGSNNRDWP
jgi:FkbM family methyltransferase